MSLSLIIRYFFSRILKHFNENVQIVGKYFNRVFIAPIGQSSLTDENSAGFICVNINRLATGESSFFHKLFLTVRLR